MATLGGAGSHSLRLTVSSRNINMFKPEKFVFDSHPSPGRGPTFGEKAAAYRSPGSTGSLAAMMRAERGVTKPGAGAKNIDRAEAARASGAYIPGMAPPEAKKPSKNAKKQVCFFMVWSMVWGMTLLENSKPSKNR